MKDSLNISDLGDFEYTFTNRELEDVLGFIERRQSGISTEEAVEDPNLPFFLPASVPLALQFQPHQSDPSLCLNLDAVACPPGEEVTGGIASQIAAAGYIPCIFDNEEEDENNKSTIPLPGSMLLPGEEQQDVTNGREGAAPSTRSKTVFAGIPQASKEQRHMEIKASISHSTVEKQRRDRINSLIDELRELVPPQPTDKEAEQRNGAVPLNNPPSYSEPSRRPKHAVLSDTIALVRDLRSQLAAVQIEATQAQQKGIATPVYTTAANTPPGTSSPSPPSELQVGIGPAAVAAAAAAAVAVAAGAASPFSTSTPGPEGVEIAAGKGCMYVKVHCRDRHGLLADIVRTLKAIHLEITTAAITTTAAGNVYDVFQVTLTPGTAKTTAENIRDSVIAVLASNIGPDGGDTVSEKKRRAR
ncbi:hypothetical protein Ndes2437B_g06847 [Nannochloris sp. 'desiccata']